MKLHVIKYGGFYSNLDMSWKILYLHRQGVTSTIDLPVHKHIRIGAAAVCTAIIRSRGSTTVCLLDVVVSDLMSKHKCKLSTSHANISNSYKIFSQVPALHSDR